MTADENDYGILCSESKVCGAKTFTRMDGQPFVYLKLSCSLKIGINNHMPYSS